MVILFSSLFTPRYYYHRPMMFGPRFYRPFGMGPMFRGPRMMHRGPRHMGPMGPRRF